MSAAHARAWTNKLTSKGTAVVMQGRYIEHQALEALGGRERISMVCAFRPKDAMVKDECCVVVNEEPATSLSCTISIPVIDFRNWKSARGSGKGGLG